MITIKFLEHDGTEHLVEGRPKQSLMEAARDNNIDGILADCGGACACATCHVMIGGEWAEKLPSMKDDERFMLEIGVEDPTADSRLSCQISLAEELDGLEVRLPESQI